MVAAEFCQGEKDHWDDVRDIEGERIEGENCEKSGCIADADKG